MLYKLAGSDAPLVLRELRQLGELTLTSRQRKSVFNRLSQGLRQIMGLKGTVTSLSMILTPSTLEIGVEMTKETFKPGETSGTLSVSDSLTDCSCGAPGGKPHEPDCKWWYLSNIGPRPWRADMANADVEGAEYKPVVIYDEVGSIVVHMGSGPDRLELAKTICHAINRL